MKIVAFSDSHGNVGSLRDAVFQALEGAPVDVCIHCGDGARDMDAVEPILRDANPDMRIYTVRGNCDIGAFRFPVMELFDVNGVGMLATHGHAYNVKSEYEGLLCAAAERGAKVAFFGHTHRPLLESSRGVYLINPGAICNRSSTAAYAQVLVDACGRLRADLIPWRT